MLNVRGVHIKEPLVMEMMSKRKEHLMNAECGRTPLI